VNFLHRLSFIGAMLLTLGNAHATLITDLSERDWITDGDSAITYDASTGLEWLDVSITVGNSILDTESAAYFGEFRWATIAEVENLLDAAVSGFYHRDSAELSDIANTALFISLFGATHTDGDLHLTRGVSRWPVSTNGIYGSGSVYYNSRIAAAFDPQLNWGFTEDISSNRRGSWLVRATSVSAPPPLTLIALGLAGLFFSFQRKTKEQTIQLIFKAAN